MGSGQPRYPRQAPKQQDWTRLLLRKVNSKGVITDDLRPVVGNAITILVHDPAWEGVLAYDEFAETIITRTIPPWRPQDAAPDTKPGDWTDEDTIRTQAWLSDLHKLDIGLDTVLSAVKVVSARVRLHPVREWLTSMNWDCKRRVGTWLIDCLGCDDTPYVREVGICFLVAAVARAMVPGCKVDTVLVLEGDQGTFKSSCLRALFGDEWFLEMSTMDIANKDAMQVLRRKWGAEMPEIDGFSTKTESAHLKSYFSRRIDTYRASYGKGARDYPRQTVFAGTTNKDQYLPDETGGRRFHPVKCRRGDPARVAQIRDQLWAEALALYEGGVPWHVVDPDLERAFGEQQADRYRAHPWEETIEKWLAKPPDVGPARAKIGVTTGDVLEGALHIDVGKRTQSDATQVSACLRRLGWAPNPMRRDPHRQGQRVRLYLPRDPSTTFAHALSDEDVIPLPEPPDELEPELPGIRESE